jgi:uncharacterized protein YbjT (DUF2867 family)
MKVLMIGATGKYAGLVVPELKQRGATAGGGRDGDRGPP